MTAPGGGGRPGRPGEVVNARPSAACFRSVAILALALGIPATPRPALSEEISRFDRQQGRMMLGIIKKDLLKYYYDETFHGFDLDEAFEAAARKIDQARSFPQIFTAIAVPLLQLDDSHTVFIPPGWSARYRFGWKMQMIGDRCFVTAVEEGSDAEAQGLKRGDLVLEVDGQAPSRHTLWVIYYVHRILAPRLRLPLLIQPPGGEPRRVQVAAKVEQGARIRRMDNVFDLGTAVRKEKDRSSLVRPRFEDVGETLTVWRMPVFGLTKDEVRTMALNRIKKRPNLILDLRGNRGGAVETCEAMVGALVGGKTRIADVRSREALRPEMASNVGDPYQGKVVVLVDSDSASASEVLARTIQMSGRGPVLGDRTSGSVMESRTYEHTIGDKSAISFEVSVTIADVIMPDGKSLERTGVTPDEILLPTAEDLAARRDPVLARAASLCGTELTPENAGKLFTTE